MSNWNESWKADYMRMTDDQEFILGHFMKDFIFYHRVRYMVYFRLAQNTRNCIVKNFFEVLLYLMCRKYGIEIKTCTRVGKGFCMIHPYNITVSTLATIGENVTMLKGSTIGVANAGKSAGAPVIGNRVYVGINSTVIGG